MQRASSYSQFQEGNVVAWSQSRWSLVNAVEETESGKTICTLPLPRHVLFPEPRSMAEHKLLCRKLKGNVTVVKDGALQNELITQLYEVFPDKKTDASKCEYHRTNRTTINYI